jgi:hypothetical protein
MQRWDRWDYLGSVIRLSFSFGILLALRGLWGFEVAVIFGLALAMNIGGDLGQRLARLAEAGG